MTIALVDTDLGMSRLGAVAVGVTPGVEGQGHQGCGLGGGADQCG